MLTRREFLAALGTTLATWPIGVRAQQAVGVPHIGYMSMGSQRSNGVFLDAFKDGLREFGYTDGKNIVIDVRWAGDSGIDFRQLAASLVKDQPKAIISTCIPSTHAAKDASRTIPVVMSVDGDPVAAGLIASFAKPGGNVTGASTLFDDLIPKWLELLTTAAPKVRNLALLYNGYLDRAYAARVEEAARLVGVNVSPFEADASNDLDRAFAEMKTHGTGGVVVLTEAIFVGDVQHIVSLANRYKLPAIYGYNEVAEAGGLMSYGLSYREYYKRVARYVDAVIRGTKPADLPVEQPSHIELVVNLKTAKALDLTIPQSLLLRADEVIR
jgi:putative tryptophan/tyrosine transport system substrate-binding protein